MMEKTIIYNVIYDVGDYSDRSWHLMGSFSSKEKAEAFIEKECFVPEPDSVREEHQVWLEKTKREYKEQSLQNSIDSLKSCQKTLTERREQKKLAKDPNWGETSIRKLKDAIEIHENTILLGGRDYPHVFYDTVEGYIQLKYRKCNKEDLHIEEHVLDDPANTTATNC